MTTGKTDLPGKGRDSSRYRPSPGVTLRRCGHLRSNSVTHFFYEGETVALCGRYIGGDEYTVRPDDEPIHCDTCFRRLPNLELLEEGRAS